MDLNVGVESEASRREWDGFGGYGCQGPTGGCEAQLGAANHSRSVEICREAVDGRSWQIRQLQTGDKDPCHASGAVAWWIGDNC